MLKVCSDLKTNNTLMTWLILSVSIWYIVMTHKILKRTPLNYIRLGSDCTNKFI